MRSAVSHPFNIISSPSRFIFAQFCWEERHFISHPLHAPFLFWNIMCQILQYYVMLVLNRKLHTRNLPEPYEVYAQYTKMYKVLNHFHIYVEHFVPLCLTRGSLMQSEYIDFWSSLREGDFYCPCKLSVFIKATEAAHNPANVEPMLALCWASVCDAGPT